MSGGSAFLMKTPQVRVLDLWVGGFRAIRPLLLWLVVTGAAQALDFTYTNVNGTITITRYIGPGGNVTVPNTIDGLPVTAIGNKAFYFLPAVTAVTISDSVTSVGMEAFGSSGNIANVSLPSGLTNIGNKAFSGCNSLSQITIPRSVTSIGDLAFGECTSLGSITVDMLNASYASAEGV